MDKSEMLLSVASVLYEADSDLLIRHLNSLYAAALLASEQYSNFKVRCFVIDNAKQVGIEGILESLPKGAFWQCEYISNPENPGYGGANNVLLDLLESDYHLVINPDVVVDERALLGSIEYLRAHVSTGLVSPYVESSRGYGAHVAKRYPDCLTLMIRFLGWGRLKVFFRERLQNYACADIGSKAVFGVELAGGCFFFLRTRDYLLLKGFDTRYFLYFEDFDLCIRMREMGKTIDYVPQVKIQHAGGDVGRKSMKHHLYFIASAVKFFNRHGWRLW